MDLTPTQLLQALDGLDPAALEAWASAWRRRLLEPGEVVWHAGEPAHGLGVVEFGALHVVAGSRRIGRIGAGEIFGEGTAFDMQATHGSTLRAVESTCVHILPPEALLRMKEGDARLYAALTLRSAVIAARRVRSTETWLAQVAPGDAVLPGPSLRGWIHREWQRLRRGPSTVGAPPPIVDVARTLPGLSAQEASVARRLLHIFKAVPTKAGRALCQEGERGDTAFLVADGHVEVLRATADGSAFNVCTAGPGDLLAAASHFLGGLRLETLVPLTDGWVYSLDRRELRALEPEVKGLWHELAAACLRQRSHLLAEHLSNRDGDAVPEDLPLQPAPVTRPPRPITRPIKREQAITVPRRPAVRVRVQTA